MTPLELRQLSSPTGLSNALHALWLDARGDWDGAHQVCQKAHNRDGDWVHAYLHRKEGDLANAGYWYSRAGRIMPAGSTTLEMEWEAIVRELGKPPANGTAH